MFKLLTIFAVIAKASSSDSYIEVEAGKSVALPCASNKNGHLFSFWELASKKIVSPGNSYDRSQYDYEVLTGKLYIFNTKVTQEGVYTCISSGVDDNANVKLSTVHLFIKKDWDDVYQHERTLNVIRIFILIGCAVLLIMGSYLLYTKWKQKRRVQTLLDDFPEASDTDETQDDDIPRQVISLDLPSTSSAAFGKP